MKQGGPSAVQEAHMKQMEEMMKQANAGLAGARISIADELAKLAKLRDQGVLSEAEFQKMKNEMMKFYKFTFKNYFKKLNLDLIKPYKSLT